MIQEEKIVFEIRYHDCAGYGCYISGSPGHIYYAETPWLALSDALSKATPRWFRLESIQPKKHERVVGVFVGCSSNLCGGAWCVNRQGVGSLLGGVVAATLPEALKGLLNNEEKQLASHEAADQDFLKTVMSPDAVESMPTAATEATLQPIPSLTAETFRFVPHFSCLRGWACYPSSQKTVFWWRAGHGETKVDAFRDYLEHVVPHGKSARASVDFSKSGVETDVKLEPTVELDIAPHTNVNLTGFFCRSHNDQSFGEWPTAGHGATKDEALADYLARPGRSWKTLDEFRKCSQVTPAPVYLGQASLSRPESSIVMPGADNEVCLDRDGRFLARLAVTILVDYLGPHKPGRDTFIDVDLALKMAKQLMSSSVQDAPTERFQA
mgnify:FL=1